MQTYNLPADATSGSCNDTTFTANPASIAVGGAATHNMHALLRFDTHTITTAEIPMEAHLQVSKSASGAGTVPDLAVWASSFSTPPVLADYNKPASNVAPLREQISTTADPILLHTAANGTLGDQLLPTRWINQGAGAYSDFEIRPATSTVGATDTLTIYGPASGTTPPNLYVVTYTLAEVQADRQTYRWDAVGADSYFAFAQETTEGVPVKPSVILDVDNIGMIQQVANLTSTALNQQRARPRKTAVGASAAGGSVTFDLTPEKCMQLLPGVLQLTNTVTNGDGTYTHTWKVATPQQIASYTVAVRRGAFLCVYRGCKINRLSLSVALDSIVKCGIDMQALEEWRYDWKSAGMNSEFIMSATAAYDTVANGVWSFVDANVTLNGTTDDCVQNFSIDFMNELRPRRGLNGRRCPTGHFAGAFGVSVGLETYFKDEVLLKTFFGVQATGYPFKPGKRVIFDSISCNLSREDIKDSFTISIPKVLYQTISDPVDSDGEIMLRIQAVGVFDESSASNVTFTLTTNEPAANFQPSTDIITVLPPDVQP